jgi:long-chain acyl-CoA synthetase
MPPVDSLLARLRAQAHRQPGRTAFLDGDLATDYGTLWRRAMRWQDTLRDAITAGDRVAVLMDNSAECAAAGYGIWAARGVWVGLNTSLKTDDLLWQMRHCGARALIVGDKFAALAEAAAADGIAVWRTARGDVSASSPAPGARLAEDARALFEPRANVMLDAPAAIIYTSGTTGQPKGVVLTHANLAANVAAIQQSLPIRPDDIALCLLPFFYAYGFSVLHTHLSQGATLMLAQSLMYPQKVLQSMADARVTSFYGVPSSYYLLLERGHLARAELPTLRYGAQAGGAMDPARIEEVCQALPHIGFYVMYGQTEACSRLTTLPASLRMSKSGSVGRALDGVTLSIRSVEGEDKGEDKGESKDTDKGRQDEGQALPPNQIGEVCARGPNVMQGYWQAPEDTARTLRGGWLHTGDLGYLDADGCLYLTGRSREQIKTGAHRVSPWEIEQLIQTVAGVREAAVVGEPDHLLGEIIHAYVIAEPPSDMLRKAILLTCKTRLAAYKVPKHLSFVPDFPRTASGKVRKHLLLDPISSAAPPDQTA